MHKLRTYNGGEYLKNKFIVYCTKQGIHMQHSVPYTPQQNGVAKRKNHTWKEMEHYDPIKGIKSFSWVEDINFVNYIFSCTPTKVLKDITLEEGHIKIKLDVLHFCVFGSEA